MRCAAASGRLNGMRPTVQHCKNASTDLTPLAVLEVTSQTGRTPWTSPDDFEHAMGVSLIVNSQPTAVICPIASRITDEIANRLAT
jgi:hypothetical protein